MGLTRVEPVNHESTSAIIADRLRLAIMDGDLAPGEVGVTKKAVFVGTGSGPVRLGTVQAPGKKAMNAADWARGTRFDENGRFA